MGLWTKANPAVSRVTKAAKNLWNWEGRDPDEVHQLRVCWADYAEGTAADREAVRLRILGTWGRYSPLNFVGWDECEVFRDEDVNIRVEHQSAIGYYGLSNIS